MNSCDFCILTTVCSRICSPPMSWCVVSFSVSSPCDPVHCPLTTDYVSRWSTSFLQGREAWPLRKNPADARTTALVQRWRLPEIKSQGVPGVLTGCYCIICSRCSCLSTATFLKLFVEQAVIQLSNSLVYVTNPTRGLLIMIQDRNELGCFLEAKLSLLAGAVVRIQGVQL